MSEWDVTLEAGRTYYLTLMPWTGEEGDHAYTIEFEWASP